MSSKTTGRGSDSSEREWAGVRTQSSRSDPTDPLSPLNRPGTNPEARSGHPFFFPAADGIRDLYVTGVQTCALPIYAGHARISGVNVQDDPDTVRSLIGPA